jgi:hypothetical protein
MAQPYDTHDHQTSQAQPMVEELRAALRESDDKRRIARRCDTIIA